MKAKVVYLLFAIMSLLSTGIAQQNYLKMDATFLSINGKTPYECKPPVLISIEPYKITVHARAFQEYKLIRLIRILPETEKENSASKTWLAKDRKGTRVFIKLIYKSIRSPIIYLSIEYDNNYWLYGGRIK